ncbi:MAG: protein O-mannosyl-transferase family [Saprospiraceae bacterium]
MANFRTLNNIVGWLVFAVAALLLAAAAEPTGSLWDCGEFISGAYKLQVVHPPGAPIFLLVGRLFAWVGSMVSANPENIAYSVNLLSAASTAGAAMFICWSATILGKLALVGRETENDDMGTGEKIAVLGTGLVAGLTTAFCSSIWFSAVEGEVYAMSTFFTCLTLWAMLKWYNAPDTAASDRWIVFAMYSSALSIGVHLLSLLTFPALALLYYFKKSRQPKLSGALVASLVGVAFIVGIQTIIITGIPNLWAFFDKLLVNSFGMPFNSGLIPLALIYGGGIWYGLRRAQRTGNGLLQKLVVSFAVMNIAYMAFGMVIIRSNANPPINMNAPSDPMRLLPYLNREQYGERPLLRGPHFDSKPADVKVEDRYGRVGDKYVITDQKIDYEYAPGDKMFFPRMQDYSQGRPGIYRRWLEKPSGTPTFGDNLEFFFKYQIGWMYWRYFMWNFSGRQNGEQGYYSWDPSAGHWISGFDFLDEGRIGNQSALTDRMKNDPAKNKYYLIPFFLGLLGLFFHWQRRPREFAALMALFIITGLGIIVYSNQPPNEPRERDYVLVGSFFTYAIWVGMSVLAIFDLLRKKVLGDGLAAPVSVALALAAPLLMVTENWDDHSRAKHYGSRDYASNFLNSCEPNAIIFTYGDNDTYPLWYAQETEGIRRDVRVVNLSLIAVDWYIDQLRRKVNDSAPIKLSLSAEQIRGYKRVQIPFYAPGGAEREMTLAQVMKFLGEDHPLPAQGGRDFDTHLPSRYLSIPVNKDEVLKNGVVAPKDSAAIVDTIRFTIGETDPKTGKSKATYITKDDLAVMDIINSNIWERPIYWAVTCREEKLLGLQDYLQLEGLGMRLVPIKTRSQDAYGIVGSGRVGLDQAFKNMTEKWKWGNFDKERLHVDRSYQPSIQTMRVSFIRVARELMMQRDTARCVALVDKYFEAFPQMNFAYDNFTTYLVQLYVQAGEYEKAKAKIQAIADETEQQLKFFDSQDPALLKPNSVYGADFGSALNSKEAIMALAREMKDDALLKELEQRFANWSVDRQLPGMELQR